MSIDGPLYKWLEVLPFCQLLRHHIEEAGFPSDAEFARAAGAKPATVSNCLNDETGPPLEQLDRWCDALKLRGAQRTTFINAAWRKKAWSQAEARPWISHAEKSWARSKRHLRASRGFIEWQTAHIEQLKDALRAHDISIPKPPTDPPEIPGPDDEPGP